jgi:anti-sigma B factor antagonist
MECYGLTVQVRQKPELTLVTVAGEVDIATVPVLREGLAGPSASGKPVVVDLDAVSFIDASGLGVLVGAANRAAAHGASLHVVCAKGRVRRLFAMTGLDRHLALARTTTQACRSVAAAGDVPRQRPPADTMTNGPGPLRLGAGTGTGAAAERGAGFTAAGRPGS